MASGHDIEILGKLTRCFHCGGTELEIREVEELLSVDQYVVRSRVPASVCLRCGERFGAGGLPIRRNQMLAGFLRDYISPLTDRAYMEGRGEGFLTMVRECERVSGRKPELAVIGDSVRLTIFSGEPVSPDRA